MMLVRALPPPQRGRRLCLLLAILVTGVSVLFWPTAPAHAAPPNQCDYKEWIQPGNQRNCVGRLQSEQTVQKCMGIPTPSAPDSGFGGWFASDPKTSRVGITGLYSTYGYSGYTYPIYKPDCASGMSPLPSSTEATTTIANGELMIATGIVGAANAFRERAYNPGSMWGWADKLVKSATKAIYQKVFSVFGVITIAIVGLYLLWRSRQADLSDAMTTAGWAILVMTVVTAVAAWPLVSAHLADKTLVSSLGIVHDTVGPRPHDIPLAQCPNAMADPPPGVTHDPSLCKDHRPPALRASDTATQAILYDNWLRGTLGSATSTTAKKYGPALYDASALSWSEAQTIRKHPKQRASIYSTKQQDFHLIAQQIQKEDPDAFNYLQGKEGSARIGAGLIAIISAVAFSFFDIAASLLIILGFLIFRWAVVAIPIIGTFALLRPASSGFKRLVNIVVAAIFNIIIFGAGASIYLFAVDLIMNTPSLPGWLQITLVWLCGIVGWLLLRPYRRITQLGGKNPMGEIAHIGSWHKRFFGDLKGVALGAAGASLVGDIKAQDTGDDGKRRRAETIGDTTTPAGTSGTVPEPVPDGTPDTAPSQPVEQPTPRRPRRTEQPAPAEARQAGYSGPCVAGGRDDERVWVPATGRYANGSADHHDLARAVGRAERLNSPEIETHADDAQDRSRV